MNEIEGNIELKLNCIRTLAIKIDNNTQMCS